MELVAGRTHAAVVDDKVVTVQLPGEVITPHALFSAVMHPAVVPSLVAAVRAV